MDKDGIHRHSWGVFSGTPPSIRGVSQQVHEADWMELRKSYLLIRSKLTTPGVTTYGGAVLRGGPPCRSLTSHATAERPTRSQTIRSISVYQVMRRWNVTTAIFQPKGGDARYVSPGCHKACWLYKDNQFCCRRFYTGVTTLCDEVHLWLPTNYCGGSSPG